MNSLKMFFLEKLIAFRILIILSFILFLCMKLAQVRHVNTPQPVKMDCTQTNIHVHVLRDIREPTAILLLVCRTFFSRLNIIYDIYLIIYLISPQCCYIICKYCNLMKSHYMSVRWVFFNLNPNMNANDVTWLHISVQLMQQ